jgi:hypothetical protein
MKEKTRDMLLIIFCAMSVINLITTLTLGIIKVVS